MRLILTESQLKLLESIIYENISSKLDEGGFIEIRMMVGDKERSHNFEITEVHGGDAGEFATITSSNGDEFIISTTGSLNTTTNTFMFLKGAEYRPADDSAGGDSPHSEEVVGGKKDVVSNVLQVNISDSSKNIIDTIYTDLGDKKKIDNSADGADRDELLKAKNTREVSKSERDKKIYDLMVNDPILKKAFYHQPTLFGGLLNYGKAKGIGPAKALLNKYIAGYNTNDEEDEKSGKSKFKIGSKVKYVLANNVNITYDSQTFMLIGKDVSYFATYKSSGKLHSREKMDDKKYYSYQIGKIKNIEGDIYKGEMLVEFKAKHSGHVSRSQEITFKIVDYVN